MFNGWYRGKHRVYRRPTRRRVEYLAWTVVELIGLFIIIASLASLVVICILAATGSLPLVRR